MGQHAEEKAYIIVFDGEILPGVSKEQAVSNLANIFKSDPVQIAQRMASGKRLVISRNLSKEEAMRRKKILNKAGIVCQVLRPRQDVAKADPEAGRRKGRPRLLKIAVAGVIVLAAAAAGIYYWPAGPGSVHGSTPLPEKTTGSQVDGDLASSDGAMPGGERAEIVLVDAPSRELINSLLDKKDFAKLDEMAEGYRKSRARTRAARWALSDFYYAIAVTGGSDEEYESRIALMEQWSKAMPSSPTPIVTLSRLYRHYAFKARGGGWASDIQKSAMQLFRERMQKAWDYSTSNTARNCIRGYSEALSNLKSIGASDVKPIAFSIFAEAYEKEPDYYPLYYAMVGLLMDRWHGDRGDIKKFLDNAAARRGGVEGKELYVLALLNRHNNYEFYNYLSRIGVTWEDLDGKLETLLKERPDSPWAPTVYWYFATVSGDFQKAEKLAKALDESNGWLFDTTLFDSQYFERAKQTYERRKQAAFIHLDISDVWNGRTKLMEDYAYVDSKGKILGNSQSKTQLYNDPSSFLYNHSIEDFVRVFFVPVSLLNQEVTVKYSVINEHTSMDATASFKVDPIVHSAQEVAAAVERCKRSNLLKNPKADEGMSSWSPYGIAAMETLEGNNVFFTEKVEDTGSHLSQDISLPYGCEKGFVVYAGYSMVKKVIEGSITNRPYLYGYIMTSDNRIQTYMQGQNMMNRCGDNCWGPMWGFYVLGDDVTSLRFFIQQGSRKGDRLEGVRAFYDDLEVRVFQTEAEALDFIENYKRSHPVVRLGGS